jgi:hypothetical protein
LPRIPKLAAGFPAERGWSRRPSRAPGQIENCWEKPIDGFGPVLHFMAGLEVEAQRKRAPDAPALPGNGWNRGLAAHFRSRSFKCPEPIRK